MFLLAQVGGPGGPVADPGSSFTDSQFWSVFYQFVYFSFMCRLFWFMLGIVRKSLLPASPALDSDNKKE